MSTLTKHQILATCLANMPAKEVKIKGLGNVTIQALRGSTCVNLYDDSSAKRVTMAIHEGVLAPAFTADEALQILDGNPTLANELYKQIMDFTMSLREAEKDEGKTAEKN